jgi:hypothetical protein
MSRPRIGAIGGGSAFAVGLACGVLVACSSSSSPREAAGGADAAPDTAVAMPDAPSGGDACSTCAATVDCPAWTGYEFPNGMSADVGQSIGVTVNAVGPNPTSLAYAWTSSNPIGTFGANNQNGMTDTTSFMCSAPGTTMVVLTITDGVLPDAGHPCGPTNILMEQFECTSPSGDGGQDAGSAADSGDAGASD